MGLAGGKGADFIAALFGELGEFGDAFAQGLLLLAEGGQELFLGGEGDLDFAEGASGGIALQTEGFEFGGQDGDGFLGWFVRALPSRAIWAARAARFSTPSCSWAARL